MNSIILRHEIAEQILRALQGNGSINKAIDEMQAHIRQAISRYDDSNGQLLCCYCGEPKNDRRGALLMDGDGDPIHERCHLDVCKSVDPVSG